MSVRVQADIADTVIQAAFWTSVLFVAVLGLFWPWWRHWFGRAMVTIDLLLAVAFGPTVVSLCFPSVTVQGWWMWVTVAGFAGIPIRTVFLTWTIWRIQRNGVTAMGGGDA